MEDFLIKSRAKTPRDCTGHPQAADSSAQEAG
jgi:hypothetical protein